MIVSWLTVRKKVSNIAFKLLAERTSLIILTILNDLKTLITVPNVDTIDNYSNNVPPIVNNTTTKSNLLNGSEKYYKPSAINFMINSNVNTPKKNKFE